METNPTRVCELLVGLPDVNVRGVDDERGGPLVVHVEGRGPRPSCAVCAGGVRVKDRDRVELVDLPVFGRPCRLVWHKRRWCCPAAGCPVGSFTESAFDHNESPSIGAREATVTCEDLGSISVECVE